MKRLLLVALLLPIAAHADEYTLTIKDHKFQPAEFTIPSGTKIRLRIENQDATPEEFDSYALNREKVIAGLGTATIFIGPLDAGRYPFTGEFHSATAHGVVVVK